MKKEKFNLLTILSPEKDVSPLQMSLTLLLTLCLILSNIVVIKSIDIFGIKALSNTCSIIVFPITYVLSDVFSEVYGYRWSRLTATWAFIGTVLCSLFFALTIAIPGNDAWTNQEALVAILGNTPIIAFGSVIAFWLGDFVNDKVFEYMKRNDTNNKHFALRAFLSSVAGKYVDQTVFTFIGLNFLPLSTKLTMILTCPIAHLILEFCVLPITSFVKTMVKRTESEI